MSIELNIALPGLGWPPRVETHYLSILRTTSGPDGSNVYTVTELAHEGDFFSPRLKRAVFLHRYDDGWERCVARALAALADLEDFSETVTSTGDVRP